MDIYEHFQISVRTPLFNMYEHHGQRKIIHEYTSLKPLITN
jgi:hypothetical protein